MENLKAAIEALVAKIDKASSSGVNGEFVAELKQLNDKVKSELEAVAEEA